MSVTNLIDTQVLVQHLEHTIKQFDAPVSEIWLREERGAVEVWIITKPIELDGERLIAQAAVRLQDTFPDQYLNFFVLNPSVLTDVVDPHEMLPTGVERAVVPAA